MSTIAKISIKNIVANYYTVKKLINPNTKICVSVKANAYGHGFEEVVKTLNEHKVDCWGIASLSEALTLKNLKVKGNTLCYTHFLPDEVELALQNNVEMFVGSMNYLKLINSSSKKLKSVASVHLMLETGMGRLGFFPQDIQQAYNFCKSSPHIKLTGFCSHFSNSSNDEVLHRQLTIFNKSIEQLQLDSNILVHIANSGAIIWSPKISSFDMVRPGIMLYGASPEPERTLPENVFLHQAMKFIGHIASIQRYSKGQGISYMSTFVCMQDTNIATVNMGYGDGLMRSLSNTGVVSINGKRYPMVGNVCMDMCMVNLGDDSASIGDEVIFFGDTIISIDEQADNADTISYILSTQITARTQKVFEY